VVGQVVAGRPQQDREEGQPDEDGVEDMVGTDRQPLVPGLQRVAAGVDLEQRRVARCLRLGRGRPGTFARPPAAGRHQSGSEMPWARMSRKCTNIRSTIRAGSRNTWSANQRWSVPAPSVGPPCRNSLMNGPRMGALPPILIVTSV